MPGLSTIENTINNSDQNNDSRFASSVGPIWKRTVTFTFIGSSGVNEVSQVVPINGILQEVVIVIGVAAGITGTIDIDLDDNDGVEFSANAALTEDSKTILAFSKPVTDFTIRCTPSAEPLSGSWVITVYSRGI